MSGAVLVVAVAAGFVYVKQQAAVRDAAQSRLGQIQQTVLIGNNVLAIQDLESFIVGRTGRTDAGREGRLLLARLYLEEARPQDAIRVLEPLASDFGSPYGVPAAFLLAAAQEEAGDTAGAEETYTRIANRAPYEYQKRDALAATARIRADAGNYAGATEVYERLLTMASDDPVERAVYELRLAEVKAAAN